jgi:uncharacterized Tic20 family protein
MVRARRPGAAATLPPMQENQEPNAREERHWEEEAGMRERSPFGSGFQAGPNERNWGVALQLAGFAKYLITPLGVLVALFFLWRFKRDDSRFLDAIGAEALNFQLSITLYSFVAGLLTWVLIGYPMLVAIVLLDLVAMVLGALRASRGEFYRYPFCLRLIS